MAVRKIVSIPHPCLRKVAPNVEVFDDALRALVDDMYETMYAASGVGLAAPQIAISKRVAVIDASDQKNEKFCLINPEIIETKNEVVMTEGCLSVPGTYDEVVRASYVRFKAFDEFGKEYEREGEGLLAEAVQHEIDHLNGKLYIDLLSPLKRKRAKAKMEKYLRHQNP